VNGIAAERRVAGYLVDRDFLVSSRRHFGGSGDILAAQHPTTPATWNPALIEVKASSPSRGPFGDFPPADRKELASTAKQFGCEPLLAWVTHLGILWLEQEDWPNGS